MPARNHPIGPVARYAQASVLVDNPPLGHLQALVLFKLSQLGTDAYGSKVLEELALDTGVWIDHAQIYAAIRTLLTDRKYIELADERRQKGAPPLKIYSVTPEGKAALKAAIQHYQALADYFSGKKPKTARS